MARRPPSYALPLLFPSPFIRNANLLPPCHAVTATLDHLVEVFKDEKNPREAAYHFYDTWLIVDKEDYIDSPFWDYKSAKSLFAK